MSGMTEDRRRLLSVADPLWERAFAALGERLIERGDLRVTLPSGRQLSFGDGSGPAVRAAITDPVALRRIVLDPDLALGEAYMDGALTVEEDDLRGLLELVLSNIGTGPEPWFRRLPQALRTMMRRISQHNPIGRAQANVAHHYDLSGELYDLFLDADKQYSCAYFERPDMTLEEAQEAKKRHIARKLLLEPGMSVLDIGCGWGGMGLTLAREWGADVTGVTLSTEQHQIANRRAEEAGLADRARFLLTDYREVNRQFDRIVSVGMFEHVGAPHYREFFRKLGALLKPEGVALLHTIGRTTPPGSTNPWIAKYIFPGGYIPAMSEVLAAIEKEGLVVTDVEVLRLHYAETLRHWWERFEANAERVRQIYDERFVRMWRFYLNASEMTFRHYGQVVFQFQIAHRQDAVPLTRDYLYPGAGRTAARSGTAKGRKAQPAPRGRRRKATEPAE